MKRLDARSRWAFGPSVVDHFLPHGPAIRMVDGIAGYRPGDRPTIETYLHIPSTHPVFASHFDGMPLWPGVYTLEGLAQTVIVAVGLGELHVAVEAAGHPASIIADGLRAIDDRAALRAAPTTAALETLRGITGGAPPKIGMLAGVSLKYERPVLPGVRLDYRATLVFDRAGSYKAEVEASVDGMRVASGSLTTVDAPG